jgi:hypothetical protein
MSEEKTPDEIASFICDDFDFKQSSLNYMREQIVKAITAERSEADKQCYIAEKMGEDNVWSEVVNERAARVVSNSEIEDLWLNHKHPSITPEEAFAQGFKKATELNSIVALENVWPDNQTVADFLKYEGFVSYEAFENWLKSHLKEKLGEK